MDQFIVTYQQLLGVLATVVGLFVAFVSWSVKAHLNRMDRDKADQRDRMDRDKAEVLARMDHFKAEVLARMDRDKADQRDRMDRDKADQRDRMDRDKAEVLAQLKQSDETGEERHRESQAALRDLSYQVGRLEGRSSVDYDAPERLGRHSPGRRDARLAATDGEPDTAQVSEPYDKSKAPLAGVRAESAHAAGLAHQAVPDQEQEGETAPEPSAGRSPDAAR